MSVDISSVVSNYMALTNAGGSVRGYKSVDVSYDNGTLFFTEDDGDKFELAAELEDTQLEELSNTLNANVASTNAADSTDKTTAVSDIEVGNGTLEENQAQLEELQAEYNSLSTTAQSIKQTIEKLSEEIQQALEEALDKQEEITEDEKTRIKDVVAEQIAQFKKDKENGKNVTLDDLNSNIRAGVAEGGFDEAIQDIAADLVSTNAKMVEMDGLLNKLSEVNNDMKSLDTSICDLQDIIDEQEKQAAAEAEAASAKSCDPIGFEMGGSKYEFVIDADGNGQLSNFSEFLGATTYFEAMKSLDTDGDDFVSKEEMKAGGLSVLVDGNSMMSLDDAFGGEDISVDLSSYQQAGSTEKYSNGQQLLGTFGLNVGGTSYTGYSTNDTADYLTSNYTFSDENPNNITAAAATDENAAEAVGTNEYDTFIENYEAKLQEFQAQFEQVSEMLGLDEELIASVKDLGQEEGEAAAQKVISEFDEKAEKAQEEQETEETEEAEKEEEDEKEKETLAA